jgi:DNA-binding NarL/FixJ family response regulator
MRLTALLLEGLPSKEIAVRIGTTCRVIKNRIVQIYNKLGVRSRFDLLKYLLGSLPTCESVSMEPRERKK